MASEEEEWDPWKKRPENERKDFVKTKAQKLLLTFLLTTVVI